MITVIHNDNPKIIMLPAFCSKAGARIRLLPGRNEIADFDHEAAMRDAGTKRKLRVRKLRIEQASEPVSNPFAGETLDAIQAAIDDETDVETLQGWLGLDGRKTIDKMIRARIKALG